MKYLLFLSFILISGCALAQNNVLNSNGTISKYYSSMEDKLSAPNINFQRFTEGTKLISVRTSDAYFHKSYMINKDGETLSSGFMSSAYFQPNNNIVVVSALPTRYRDSFNPYGAYDMMSMIVLSTFNNFISRLKINQR